MDDETKNDLLALTADIVAAHVANNRVATSEVAELISSVHSALSGLAEPQAAPEVAQEPAVPIRSSIKTDYIVCLEDGKKLKMLKRYLRTNYDMTPDDYRAKWGLPRDYPMVAPAYAEQRRGLAKKIGLGRKPGTASASVAAPAAAPVAAEPKRRGRPPKAKPAPVAAPAPEPKKRGRPRKVAPTAA